jgi:hypothetical protein
MVLVPKAVRVRTTNGWQDIAIQGAQGRPGGALVKIADVVLSAAAPNIDFQNIPQNFEHLQLVATLRGDQAGAAWVTTFIRLNGDSGNNYYPQRLRGIGSTAAAYENVPYSANFMAPVRAEIPSYQQPGILRTILSEQGQMVGFGASGVAYQSCFCPWNSTAAVNRITLVPASGNLIAGSRATLYGYGTQDATQWTDIYCQLPQDYRATGTSCANGLWTQVIIPDALTITKSDGVNNDFTRNADGSVTINKAGNYHFESVLGETTAAWPDASSINFGLAKANNRAPTTNDWLTVGQYTSGSATNNYPTCPVSADLYCAAGDRINAWCWHNSGAARTLYMRLFSIARVGAGPPGPAGPLGGQVTQTYAVTSGYTADRAFNPEATSLTEVARVLGSLIDDMKLSGLVKP